MVAQLADESAILQLGIVMDDDDAVGCRVDVELDSVRVRGERELKAEERILAGRPGHAAVRDAKGWWSGHDRGRAAGRGKCMLPIVMSRANYSLTLRSVVRPTCRIA